MSKINENRENSEYFGADADVYIKRHYYSENGR